MTALEHLEVPVAVWDRLGFGGAWEHCLLWVFLQRHISPRFQYAEHSPATTHSEFLHVVLNKLLIIFPLIIHLTEEQVE